MTTTIILAATRKNDIIYFALQHEECMYCEYTPANLKKELATFFSY